MNDSNLGIQQPSRPWTNEIFTYLPQCNGDVLSDRRESVVEFLFNACGNDDSTMFRKYNSNKCMLANSFFKPTCKIIISVTQRTYFCTSYEKSYVT